MRQHAQDLNRMIGDREVNDHLPGNLRLLFRPETIESVLPTVIAYVQRDQSLKENLYLLRGAATAADREARQGPRDGGRRVQRSRDERRPSIADAMSPSRQRFWLVGCLSTTCRLCNEGVLADGSYIRSRTHYRIAL